MKTRRVKQVLVAGIIGLFAGCVDRRYVVDTNVPGAQIYVDGKQIGPSPADGWFVYPGKYEFKAVAPEYQPQTKMVRFHPRWYDIPGLDFVAECVLPFRIEDVRHVRLDLEPAKLVRTDELLSRADELRTKGQSLPPPSVPDDDPGPKDGRDNVPPKIIPPGPPFNNPAQPLTTAGTMMPTGTVASAGPQTQSTVSSMPTSNYGPRVVSFPPRLSLPPAPSTAPEPQGYRSYSR